jgi:hypothetical protein
MMALFAAGGANQPADLMGLLAAQLLIAQDELQRAETILSDRLENAGIFSQNALRPWRAVIEAAQGRTGDALVDIARCREALTDDTDEWGGLTGLVDLAEGLCQHAHGDRPDAEHFVASALDTARREQNPWDEAEMLIRWGQALATQGNVSAALLQFDAAAGVYRRASAGQVWPLDAITALVSPRHGFEDTEPRPLASGELVR